MHGSRLFQFYRTVRMLSERSEPPCAHPAQMVILGTGLAFISRGFATHLARERALDTWTQTCILE